MIIVFPMLVSRAVSDNSIPAIAKTIENYILMEAQSMIIDNKGIQKQSRGMFGRLLMAGGRLIMKEDVDLSEAAPPGTGPGSKGKGGVDPTTRQMYDEEQDILDQQWKDLEKEKDKVLRKLQKKKKDDIIKIEEEDLIKPRTIQNRIYTALGWDTKKHELSDDYLILDNLLIKLLKNS